MKKVINRCWVLICLLSCFSSCSTRKEGPAEYIRSVQSSKQLNKEIKVGKMVYTFCTITPELTALKSSLGDDGVVNEKAYQQKLEQLQGYFFLNINQHIEGSKSVVLKYNLKDPAEYEQRVMYYEFYARNDIKFLCNGKEYSPIEYQYENHMDLAPYNTIVLAFPKIAGAKEWQIIFSDRAFNNLFLKANFAQQDINELPRLVIN